MDIELDLQGANKLLGQFDVLLSALETELKSAMQDIVHKIEATARRHAPVDTGNLRASIESTVEQLGQAAVRGVVGTNVSYAIHQEFGTIYQQAQPFLRPALDEYRGYITNRFEQAVSDAEGAV